MMNTYFICLSFLVVLTDVVRCKPDYEYTFNFEAGGWLKLYTKPETWEEAYVRCHNDDVVRCKPDYEYTFNFEAGGWLKLYTKPETWEEAYVRCHNDGAVLASPLNKELANALRAQLTQFGVNDSWSKRIFLGTHDLFSHGHFTSVEGVPLTDMEIRWGLRADGAGTGDCLTMSVDGRAYYSSCKDSLPYICYRTMNECGTIDDEYHLNQQTGSCYKVHPEQLFWPDAYAICASEGGHLVILNDEEEAGIVKKMFPALSKDTDPFEKIHIGLRAWGKSRTWTTIQGESINDVYNNWYPGQPDNFEGKQDRGAFLRDGHLDDIGARVIKAMFVCEKSPKSKLFEATVHGKINENV